MQYSNNRNVRIETASIKGYRNSKLNMDLLGDGLDRHVSPSAGTVGPFFEAGSPMGPGARCEALLLLGHNLWL